jgi:PPE-repeat protein
MDFGALPPEVNSGRMYVGPGPATLLAASAVWQGLAADLHSAASSYQSVVSGLTDESWVGPSSMSMLAAITPYLQWMRTAAAQCEEAATRATAAAAAYETAFAMTVPPPTVVANRIRLATLIATNSLGQNTPAIAATEAEYSEMWVQDATAMYDYAVSSATASAFKTFMSPPQTTNPSGPAVQAGTVIRAASAKAQTTSAQLISSVPQALQNLATPGASGTARISHAAMGSAASLGSSAASAPVGLGSASAGFGAYAGGLGFDSYGLSPDFHGAGSILGAEGSADGAASAGLGHADLLGTVSVPPSWADALSVDTPAPVLDANVMPGGWGAMPSTGTGPVFKPPLGAMAGHEAGGAVRRVGFRFFLIPRSPLAG